MPFDPLYIVLEIIGLQTIFYMSYILIVLGLDKARNIPFSNHQIFDYAVFRFSTCIGTTSIIGLLVASICASFCYAYIEGRARKALDYLSTTLFIHLLISTYLCAFPKSFSWWITFFASWTGSITIAELVSAKIEMQPISLDKSPSKSAIL